MGHRRLFSTSQIPEIDQGDADHLLQLQQPFLTGNDSFDIPVENIGLNLMPCVNLTMRRNDQASSSSIPDMANVRLPNSEPSIESYSHQSAAGCSSQFPLHNGQPFYSQQITYEEERAANQTGKGKRPSKRKRSAASTVCDVMNTNGFYMTGTPSELCGSSNNLHQMPALGSQVQHWDINNINASQQGKRLSVTGEPSQRNVRPRPANVPQVNPNTGMICFCDDVSQHLLAPRNLPGPSTTTQWSPSFMLPTSHGRFPSPASGCIYHGMIQTHVGSSNNNGSEENSINCNLFPGTGPSTSLPIFRPPERISEGSNIGFGPRVPYVPGSVPSYSSWGFASTSLNEIGCVASAASAGHSMPLSINGNRNRERNPRTRSSHGRSQLFPNADNARGRWIPEGSVAVGRFAFQHPGFFLDLYRDMRLDVDNMSYEELLALEERIGNVNVGLSEDVISRCLKKTIYCSSDQVEEGQHENDNCVICLESFVDRVELGILRCGHDYHASCIKQWLQIKNACPICKCSAIEK